MGSRWLYDLGFLLPGLGVDIRGFIPDPQTENRPLSALLYMECLKMALKYKSSNSACTGRILSLSLHLPALSTHPQAAETIF